MDIFRHIVAKIEMYVGTPPALRRGCIIEKRNERLTKEESDHDGFKESEKTLVTDIDMAEALLRKRTSASATPSIALILTHKVCKNVLYGHYCMNCSLL